MYKKTILSVVFSVVPVCMSGNLHAQPEGIPVQIQVQYDSLWCWAAASTSVLNRYGKYPGIEIEPGDADHRGQCLLANKSRTNNSVDCCVEAEYCNYVTPSVTKVRDILNAHPIH